MRVIVRLLFGAAVATWAAAASAQQIDWQKVDDAFGRKGAVAGDVHRYGFPRTDLQVSVDGVTIKPAFALGGWIAMKPVSGGAMAMGDLVMLDTEINPVMSKLIENGIDVTAVHNHLLRANPATFYMHVSGHGDPVKLAQAIHAALGASKTPLAASAPASPAPAGDLDTAQLEQILGAKGQANGGVYQFAVPRRDGVVEHGAQLVPPGPTGVATAINFQPTGGGKAAITGDLDRKSTRLNSSHLGISYAVFCLKKKMSKRLCDRAGAGQILCSGLAVELLGGRRAFRFGELGVLELKGLSVSVAWYEVHYEGWD